MNHNYVRDIIPNTYDTSQLQQHNIDNMFLHINNTPRKSLGGRTPVEMMKIYYPKDYEKIFKVFKLEEIPRDDVTLKPYILK